MVNVFCSDEMERWKANPPQILDHQWLQQWLTQELPDQRREWPAGKKPDSRTFGCCCLPALSCCHIYETGWISSITGSQKLIIIQNKKIRSQGFSVFQVYSLFWRLGLKGGIFNNIHVHDKAVFGRAADAKRSGWLPHSLLPHRNPIPHGKPHPCQFFAKT